ncbi:hypothetical protein D5018_04245 [Parashewanella curva]|uniref:Uncharacterized protein n=1 Tax=Parashewanella curva TaxID=2338552 RepID=A0A3L8Q2D7_9GAMM|nr:hypothetical protein D5018_04245 [Parashewanella curva]
MIYAKNAGEDKIGFIYRGLCHQFQADSTYIYVTNSIFTRLLFICENNRAEFERQLKSVSFFINILIFVE